MSIDLQPQSPPTESSTINGTGSGTGPIDPVKDESTASAPSEADSIRAAFMLGWSIAELRGRVQVAAVDPTALGLRFLQKQALGDTPALPAQRADPLPLQIATDNPFWLAARWRVLFERISTLHGQLLPHSSTANTRYDPGTTLPTYLYPSASIDYADIGIPRYDASGAAVLPAFQLHETTRRAMNCLILLYLDPQASLIPESVASQQAELLQAVFATTAQPTPDPSTHTPLDATTTAIPTITTDVVRFVDAWDSYLHETFYTVGMSARDETRLVAYLAGQALAALSWNISLGAVALEGNDAIEESARSQTFAMIWRAAFAQEVVSPIQHYITVIGYALDALACSGQGLAIPESPDTAPSRPSQAMQAVKQSLSYWQRSAQWLSDPTHIPEGGMSIASWRTLRLTLIDQLDIWQALVMGQEALQTFTAEHVIQRIVQEVVASFEEIAVQRGLVEKSVAISQQMQTMLHEVDSEIDDLEKIVQSKVHNVFEHIWLILVCILIGSIGITLSVFVIQNTTSISSFSLLPQAVISLVFTAFTGLGLYITRLQHSTSIGLLETYCANAKSRITGMIGTIQSSLPPLSGNQGDNASSGTTSSVQNIATLIPNQLSTAGVMVVNAIERGYSQIRTDLVIFRYTIAVTYPLIEYFVLNNEFKTICNDYDFMTNVLWDETDRNEEIMRVAYAAFGPLGMIAGVTKSQAIETSV